MDEFENHLDFVKLLATFPHGNGKHWSTDTEKYEKKEETLTEKLKRSPNERHT